MTLLRGDAFVDSDEPAIAAVTAAVIDAVARRDEGMDPR